VSSNTYEQQQQQQQQQQPNFFLALRLNADYGLIQ
jgi:hypothetical protein